MTGPATADEPARRLPGRPARINRQMIAEAAHELGLEGLTLRAVADHLDVSIAALYHHVDGKDSLMRLAAELSSTKVPLPVDRGQHWAVWLYEWARYTRDAFRAEPEVLKQYLEGAISPATIAAQVDVILGVLLREGFTVREANEVYELVSSCGLGMAAMAVREQQAAAEGAPTAARLKSVVDDRPDDELVHLRALLAAGGARPPDPFDEAITTVLRGIAARRGVPWKPIAALLAPNR
jgi:AcrR family transcriptional regulator